MLSYLEISSTKQINLLPLNSTSLKFQGHKQDIAKLLTRINNECHLAKFLTESLFYLKGLALREPRTLRLTDL